jgi:hypothetical protein
MNRGILGRLVIRIPVIAPDVTSCRKTSVMTSEYRMGKNDFQVSVLLGRAFIRRSEQESEDLQGIIVSTGEKSEPSSFGGEAVG